MSETQELLIRWKASLPTNVSVGGALAKNTIAYKWKAPYRSLVLRETLFWRTYDLLNRAQKLHDEKQTLGSRILLRSALETVAVLIHLNQLTSRVLDGSLDFHLFDDKTRKLLLGSRNGSTKHTSINVLSILEYCEKKYPGVLSVYATLSESAHPNFEGVCFGYSDVDEERDETVFGAKWFEMLGDKHNSLFMLTAVVFETKYNDVLAPQIEQLERWLTDNDKELQPLGGEDA